MYRTSSNFLHLCGNNIIICPYLQSDHRDITSCKHKLVYPLCSVKNNSFFPLSGSSPSNVDVVANYTNSLPNHLTVIQLLPEWARQSLDPFPDISVLVFCFMLQHLKPQHTKYQLLSDRKLNQY